MRYAKLSHGLNEMNMTRIWNKFIPLDMKPSNGTGKQIHPVRNGKFSNGAGASLKPRRRNEVSLRGRRKVFVGLSGGVDSSVSAALLKKQGYEVTGVFIKVWQADFLPCTWREERRDAMRVAAHLGIPFLTLDLEKEYKKEVVDYMIREYGAGRVPNPDVMCNKHVKFGAFLDFAKKHGANFIATGHYARIVTSPQSLVTSKYRLFKGVDKEKDQSYFLWTLTQKQLACTLFPVGHLRKSEVRELAHKFGLPNAEKKDSQGLCFMGAIDMAEFLKHYLKTERGNVLNDKGNIIGTHEGAILYTIGQRHGFSVKKKSAKEEPYFVVAKDVAENTITVEHRNFLNTSENHGTVTLRECNYISKNLESLTEKKVMVRTRYRGQLEETMWRRTGGEEKRNAELIFKHPIGDIAAGQSAVFYERDECLGGGIIRTINNPAAS